MPPRLLHLACHLASCTQPPAPPSRRASGNHHPSDQSRLGPQVPDRQTWRTGKVKSRIGSLWWLCGCCCCLGGRDPNSAESAAPPPLQQRGPLPHHGRRPDPTAVAARPSTRRQQSTLTLHNNSIFAIVVVVNAMVNRDGAINPTALPFLQVLSPLLHIHHPLLNPLQNPLLRIHKKN